MCQRRTSVVAVESSLLRRASSSAVRFATLLRDMIDANDRTNRSDLLRMRTPGVQNKDVLGLVMRKRSRDIARDI